MRVIKKINNNVVLCIDGSGKELVAFGKGIGFGQIPYDVELQKVDRTFYNVNEHYLKLLNEIPEIIFKVSVLIIEYAQSVFKKGISSNVVFSLADHISFSVERMNKAMNVEIPFAYDVEHLYPKEIQVARYGIKLIQKYLKIRLPKSEVIGIALHFINSTEYDMNANKSNHINQVIERMTEIIESELGFSINRTGFNYYRFCNHCRYFIKRLNDKQQYEDLDWELYEFFENKSPLIHQCAIEIDQYISDVFHVSCSKEEILYLMMHIKRLYSKEDCNH